MRDIADQFDVYLVDQYGVLHDGVAAYPGAIDGLARIADHARDVIVLTNSGKNASDNMARLAQLGFSDCRFRVLSSGEVGLQLVRSGGLGPRFTLGAAVCVIGRRGDRYAFSSDVFDLVTRPDDAAFLVFAGSDAPRTSLDSYRALLQTAAQTGVPAICVNPDITMIRDGELVPAPGAIARIYQDLGGQVDYVGKPDGVIFRHALGGVTTDVERAIMVGDSPEHDVCGGRAMGLSTLLVRTGIHRSLGEPELLSLCAACGGTPDFLTASFKW
ncbi:TIGR01459 family HAD-type hydrolase [Bradyrhizobium diazoefficiens]|uniref:TIGR01459 family HAD-type hydrolase n=1 Tax=Bradyrhizobium diazoefficiens TaxID=1355477 RepID=UPI00190AC7FE|nr:TIGR01459 family HAD-type hydrolase [Bradyrhizobium diazoefficiens]QQO16261.1 TIGR01459 family HAD-type hydrolase [Bradyrhizobium diazoefficiens]